MTTMTFEEMERRSIPEPNTGCWLWMGAIGASGYGSVNVPGVRGGPRAAHRVMYAIAHGPIPPRCFVLHRCDQRSCINPAHLVAGTHDDNVRDMVNKRRHARGSKNGRARLTEDAVRAIRSRHAAGDPLAQIANDFGTSALYICHIANGWRWGHVT